MMNKLEQLLGEGVRLLLLIGIVSFFGYLFYQFAKWLLFGNGQGVLFFGVSVFVLYLIFGYLPDWLSRRWECTRWKAERRVGLFLLFLAGAFLGSYWIPTNLHIGPNWYWRIVLGVAVGWLALVTRRYK
jgi:multisubunit Na+/H+ antiporter MnhB subunit